MALSSMSAKSLLLSMLTGDVEARVATIVQLTTEIEAAVARLSRIAHQITADGFEVAPVPSSRQPLSVTDAAEVATWAAGAELADGAQGGSRVPRRAKVCEGAGLQHPYL
jgi:hypothetical protein